MLKAIVKEIKKMAVGALAIVSLALASDAQPVYQSIPLPISYIAGGWPTPGLWTQTNLSSGWVTTTYLTNVTTAWSSSASAFVNTTNIYTNSVTTYADFSAIGQPYVVIQSEHSDSGSTSTSNEVLQVSRSLTAGRFDTLNNIYVTNAGNGVTPSVGVWQIDMRGYPYGRIVNLLYMSTNNAAYYTNLGKYYTLPGIRQRGLP